MHHCWILFGYLNLDIVGILFGYCLDIVGIFGLGYCLDIFDLDIAWIVQLSKQDVSSYPHLGYILDWFYYPKYFYSLDISSIVIAYN